MNTQNQVKSILKIEQMDLWTLAMKAHISTRDLETLMFTGKSTTKLKNKINNYIESLGRCPECLLLTRREGGCIHCVCGWSIC
jgi:hypothetical protein